MLQEDLRHENTINEYNNNQNNMIKLQEQTLQYLKNEIVDIKTKIKEHKLKADNIASCLTNEANQISNNTVSRTLKHDKEVNGLNNLIKIQDDSSAELKTKTFTLEMDKNNLETNIIENTKNFNKNLASLIEENEGLLSEKESKIEFLSGNVAKLQHDVANNIDEIRAITDEKNTLVNYLAYSY